MCKKNQPRSSGVRVAQLKMWWDEREKKNISERTERGNCMRACVCAPASKYIAKTKALCKGENQNEIDANNKIFSPEHDIY